MLAKRVLCGFFLFFAVSGFNLEQIVYGGLNLKSTKEVLYALPPRKPFGSFQTGTVYESDEFESVAAFKDRDGRIIVASSYDLKSESYSRKVLLYVFGGCKTTESSLVLDGAPFCQGALNNGVFQL